MLEVAVALVLGLIGLAFGQWYQSRRNRLNTFKKLNIPGPEPHFFFGNMREYMQKGPVKAHQEWTKKYGKVFGYYFGGKPVLVVGDADLLRQIQIKDFQNFINRPMMLPGGVNTAPILHKHLIAQKFQKWKDMRAILTPSFTSGKMKQMVPILQGAIDEFISGVEKYSQSGDEFNVYPMYKALTLDVISRTSFGIRSDVQNNPRTDDFLLAIQDIITEDTLSGLTLFLACVPEFRHLLLPFRYVWDNLRSRFGRDRLAELMKTCQAILRSRQENPKNRRIDLMQLMLDAQVSQADLNNASAESLTAGYETDVRKNETTTKGSVAEKLGQKKVYRMTEEEILSNITLVLLAGFDTTSTALGFTTHVLVNSQEIQDRIREEIREVFEKDGILDFTNVSKCKYLDQVLNESLRYFPPVVGFVNRECVSDATYGDLIIPKGMAVQIAISLHRDSDYWPDPDVFDPERFSADNKKNIHPMAFQAFGSGPRNCIGMRFGQMEAKLALANLLLKYKLVPGERTEKDRIEILYKYIFAHPKNGIVVKAKKIE